MRTLRLTLLVAVVACLGVITAADAAKRPTCKAKSEQKGCSLKKTATYAATLADGGTSSVLWSEARKEFAIEVIPSGGCAIDRGAIARGVFGKTLKVGRTYSIDEETLTRYAVNSLSGTLKITTAKKATFKGTWTSYKEAGRRKAQPEEVLCQRSIDTTMTRRK